MMNKIILNIIFISFLVSHTNYKTYSVFITSPTQIEEISNVGAIIDHYYDHDLLCSVY